MQLRIGSLLFAGAMASRIHSLDASVDAIGDLVAEDMDVDLSSSAELSVDEALLSLDQDGDGSISKAEFQAHADVQEITEYLAWLQEHAGESWPAEPEARFEFLDEDGSGHLDPHEQERATSMAEAAVLISRQATQSNGSSLEGTMAKKVEDPRCESAGEGFKCLTDKSMIYCTAKKRMGNEETCGWAGKCKRGILGSGGCDYPLCRGKANGKHCGTHHGSKVVVQCSSRAAHGRFERESSLVESCHGSCHSFPDGPPPSRRRRTCNGGHVCTFGDCDTYRYALMESEANVTGSAQEEADEEAAGMQWTVDGCARVQPENRNRDQQISKWDTAAVRCCSYHAQKCESKLVGCRRQTYQAAKQTCAAHGMRLCSWHEMKTNLCCGTGCNFDVELAWVLGGSYAKRPVDFDPNGRSPVHAPRRRYVPAPRRRYVPAHSYGCYKTPDPQDPPFARCR